MEQVKALTGGLGVDYGFWAVSTPATIRQTFDATRVQGLVVIVGMTPPGTEVRYRATITRTVTRGAVHRCSLT